MHLYSTFINNKVDQSAFPPDESLPHTNYEIILSGIIQQEQSVNQTLCYTNKTNWHRTKGRRRLYIHTVIGNR